jgi:signal transduction histidine kinase
MSTVEANTLDALYEALPEAVIVLGTGNDIVSLNPSAAALFGVDRSGILGKPLSVLHADDAAVALAGDLHVYRKANGDLFRASTQTIVVAAQDHGRSTRILVLREAPERAPVESPLDRRAMDDALNVISEGVAVYDRNERLILFNTAYRKLFGTVGSHLKIGMTLTEIVRYIVAEDELVPAPLGSPEADAWVKEQVERFRLGDGVARIVSYANGRWLQLETTLTPDGNIVAIRVDVTDLKLQQLRIAEQSAELERKNASLDRFTSSVAHDLKAPLRHVSKFAEMIAADIAEGNLADIADYAEHLRRSTQRMTELVDNLLDYARIADRIIQSRPVRVRDVINDALTGLQSDMEDCGATVHIGPLPDVVGDPELLGRLFQNIIGNAIKYRRPNVAPRITIEGHRDQSVARFIFTDNGIGIDPQYAEKIFEIFQRLHRNEAVYPGTGVGLSLAKRIADSHKGVIALDPTYRDGARFVVTIPVS